MPFRPGYLYVRPLNPTIPPILRDMDLPTLANWLGAVTGVLTLCVWFWKSLALLRSQTQQLKNSARLEEALAIDLTSRATNPERRADIYTYFTIRAIDTAARRQRAHLIYLGAAMFILFLIMYGRSKAYIPISLALDWRGWLYNALLFTFIGATGAIAYFDRGLRLLEAASQTGFRRVLRSKLDRHTEA